MSPDHPDFPNLPMREQVRILRFDFNWKTSALCEEYEITAAKVRRWCVTDEQQAKLRARVRAYNKTEYAREANKARCRKAYLHRKLDAMAAR